MTAPLLIGRSLLGRERGRAEAPSFHAVNPATGAALEPAYRPASAEEIRRAAELAENAFSIYRRTSGRRKAAFLRRIAGEIEALGDALLDRYVLESGLPAARAQGERGRTCAQLRLFADLVEEGSWVDARIDFADPDRQPVPRPDTRSMLHGIGPVAVFGPANFPLAFTVAGGDAVSALAAGCPVVVKAHSSHPGTSELVGLAIGRAIEAEGMPEGVFSLLFDSGREVGKALVEHPAIKAVGFTGSLKAGRELFDLCARRPEPIPFFGELSSGNPVFLLPHALCERAEAIARGLHASVTMGVGQFCTNPGLVVAPAGSLTENFIRHLSGFMAASPAGVMLNRGTRRGYGDGIAKLRAHPQITTHVPGECDPGPGEATAAAALFESSVAAFLADESLHEEVFGPGTLILTHDSRDELMRFARGLEGHLTATIHGTPEDLHEYRALIAVLETKVGRLVFNGFPTGVEVGASMVHGGPWPATTDSRFTAVGTAAIFRFARPVCYQDCPEALLPDELKDGNPLGIERSVAPVHHAQPTRDDKAPAPTT